jgi:hypothetical protein
VGALHACSCVFELLTDVLLTISCASRFYLGKPYLSTSPTPANGLTAWASGLLTAHDLSDNDGRVECFLGNVEGVKDDCTFHSTSVACGAGQIFDTSGM